MNTWFTSNSMSHPPTMIRSMAKLLRMFSVSLTSSCICCGWEWKVGEQRCKWTHHTHPGQLFQLDPCILQTLPFHMIVWSVSKQFVQCDYVAWYLQVCPKNANNSIKAQESPAWISLPDAWDMSERFPVFDLSVIGSKKGWVEFILDAQNQSTCLRVLAQLTRETGNRIQLILAPVLWALIENHFPWARITVPSLESEAGKGSAR